jgi:hypothetical protein
MGGNACVVQEGQKRNLYEIAGNKKEGERRMEKRLVNNQGRGETK